MNPKKLLGAILAICLLVGGVVAAFMLNSSSSASERKNAASLKCEEVVAVLDNVNVEVGKAKSKVEDESGTPGESDAKDALQEAETYLKQVEDRKKECADGDDADAAECPDSWVMKTSTPDNGDVVEEVPSIKEAKTKAEARAAANDWVNLVKDHPETLKGAAAFILDKKVNAKALVDDEGCATDRAKDVVKEIKTALALSQISPDQAPADGRNSGADPKTGEVYAYNFVGVSGDRKAVKIVLPDGRVVWVMARCGNPVVKTPPPVKTGCKKGCNPPPKSKCVPPNTWEPGYGCVKPSGQNDGHSDQPVGEHPQGGTPGAGPEPKPNPKGPKPVDGSPAPDPTPGGYDSGSDNGSGTPGGSTCDSSGCSGGGSTPASPGTPPVVDDGTHSGDPGGF